MKGKSVVSWEQWGRPEGFKDGFLEEMASSVSGRKKGYTQAEMSSQQPHFLWPLSPEPQFTGELRLKGYLDSHVH